MVAKIIDGDDELKNIAEVLTYNSQNSHQQNKKLDLERTEWIGKTI